MKNHSEVTLPMLQRITKDILKCLGILKKFGIIHCDLKPENILFRLDPSKGVKVIDFGSATFLDDVDYSYLQTRPYRAPEVSLGCKFDFAIDMWSLGCILFEMVTGKLLFPYTSVQENLVKAMSINRVFNLDYLGEGSARHKFLLNNSVVCLRSEKETVDGGLITVVIPKGDFKLADEFLPYCYEKSVLDFIEKCVNIDPTKRLTVEGALEHEFLKKNFG
jgi:serine/threonine protein kinase